MAVLMAFHGLKPSSRASGHEVLLKLSVVRFVRACRARKISTDQGFHGSHTPLTKAIA
jgi:hypothetical protein